MSGEIERYDVGGFIPTSFQEVGRMATMLAKARGFVPRALEDNPGAIAACILTGAELGIGPMQSLRSIHVVDGRPMLSADLMASLALRRGVRLQWLCQTEEEARVRLTREGFEPHEQVFTMADAKRAGLAGRGNWTKYPAAMLRARCMSSALRAFCPDVIGSGVYVEGEIVSDEPAPPAMIDATPKGEPVPERQPSAVERVIALIDAGDLDAAKALASEHKSSMSRAEVQRLAAAFKAAAPVEAAPVEAPEAAE